MINKFQSLGGKTKLKIQQNISDYCDQMKYMRQSNTFKIEEDPFATNAQVMRTILHGSLVLLKILQTKPLFKLKSI